jgi:hypothetical protein
MWKKQIVTVMLVIATTCQAREVIKEITQSTRLNGNLVYYVDNPPLLIHGSIEVIIPSGTTFVIKEDFNVPAIKIYDQAMVWFGFCRGTTGPFDFPQQNDSNSLVQPVKIIGESGLPFNNNSCRILIERTASSKCILNNIFLQGFNYGLIVDKPLDTLIYGIYIVNCWNGFQLYGSNRIKNSYVSNYGLDPDPQYTGYAYEFFANSRDGNVAYDNANYVLHHCLADDGGYAFNGHGTENPDTYPTLWAYDCASTNNYSGFNLFDGYISYLFLCPGIYNNNFDKNDPDLIFDYPIYVSNNPLVKKTGDPRIFLDPNSDFVDGGYSKVSDSGLSTRLDGKPDDGFEDIWPRYQTKSWTGLKSDLNNDGRVDFNDLFLLVESWMITDEGKKADIDRSEFVDIYDVYILFNHWLLENSNINNLAGEPIINFEDFAALAKFWQNEAIYPVNINSDGICNLTDFSILASEWLMEDIKVGFINLDNPDGSNYLEGQTVSGNIGISILNPPPSTVQYTVYVDNTIAGTYSAQVNTSESWVAIPTTLFCNGWHDIKVSTTDSFGTNINHKPVKIFFDNLISNLCTTQFYSTSSPKIFLGFNDKNVPLNVQVSSRGSVLWSQLVTGDSINLQIPGSIFSEKMFADISIKPNGALMEIGGIKTANSNKEYMAAASGSSSGDYSGLFSGSFDVANYPNGIRVIFICPNYGVTSKFMPAINAWIDCFVTRGIPLNRIAVLYREDAREDNLKLAFWNGGTGSRKYVLYFGHGNSMAGPVQRTFIQAWKLDPGALFFEVYREVHAFSYTHSDEPLPGNWDNEGIDLSVLNLRNAKTVQQMWMFGCKLGQYSDMAETFGMFSDWNMGHADQIYGGFKNEVIGSSLGIIDTVVQGVENGSIIMAETLGQHRSVLKALEAVQASGNSQKAYWGPNGVMNGGGDDNFLLYGSWLLDTMYIELSY